MTAEIHEFSLYLEHAKLDAHINQIHDTISETEKIFINLLDQKTKPEAIALGTCDALARFMAGHLTKEGALDYADSLKEHIEIINFGEEEPAA